MNLKGLKRYFLRLKEPARKKKATIFLVCFISSALFWTLLKLSTENQAMLSVPVAVTGISGEQLLYEKSDSILQYTMQTTGARLFASLFFSQRDTLRLPLSSLSRLERDGEVYYFLTHAQASARLESRLEAGRTIMRVWPDTLFVRLSEKFSGMLPIRPRAEISYERRYGSYGPLRLRPDSVWVEGPRQLLDTLSFVETETLILRDLNQTIEVQAAIVPPDPHPSVRVVPDRTNLVVPVGEFTEASLEVELTVHCPDTLNGHMGERLRLFPQKVQLTILVALKDYGRVNPSLFSAMVICPDASREGSQLEVVVDRYPDFVRVESIRPSTVDYLILE
jgi:hypothetical protein